jgi:hypothetical protein
MGEPGEPTRQTRGFITIRRHQSQSTGTTVLNLVLTEDTNPELRASECTVNTTARNCDNAAGATELALRVATDRMTLLWVRCAQAMLASC